MLGADAAFARPAAGAATAATFALGGYSASQFTSTSAFSAAQASGGGTLTLSAQLRWPAGSSIKFNYGTGAYSGGSATGADGMLPHTTFPPVGCLAVAADGSPSLTWLASAAAACP